MQPALQRLLWVQLALFAVRVMSNEVYVGQLQETALHTKESALTTSLNHDGVHEHKHEQQHHLRLRSGELRRLLFPKPPAALPGSGTHVMIRTLPLEHCSGADTIFHAICVGNVILQEGASLESFATGQPQGQMKMKALIMQLKVCGQGPATTPSNLAGALFDAEANSQAENLQSMFNKCSYGNADFSRASGVEIVSAVVPIDCGGKTPWGAPYDSMLCPYTEWSDVANDYVKNVLGINWQDYKYKIYVVPPGDLCSWGGMGWVGCKSDCRAWISGDLWMYPTTWMHELGHNLYLNHAGSYQPGPGGSSQYIAYKDDSGTMGHCCSTRCFNAPHSYQLGWSKAVDTLSKDNFAAGEWHSYTLPPRAGASSKDTNFVHVKPDWDGVASAFNLFLEYRKGESYDTGLLPSVRDKVSIYSTPGGDAMPFTTFEVAVGANQISHESRIGSHLAIWVGAESAAGIRVNLCRPLADQEINCQDGKDDDCDGFVDEEDSDCRSRTTSRRLLSWL